MDLNRARIPLGVVLRAAFSLVTAAALVVDVWVLDRGTPRTMALACLTLAALGAAWAYTLRMTAVVASSAAAVSLAATTTAAQDGLQYPVFTELAVLPVLFGAALATRTRWRWPAAAAVAVAAVSLGLRAGDSPLRWMITSAMVVLLGTAGAAVVYIRVRDQERHASVESARQSERLELARELHDVVGHHVTGIVVLAQASAFAPDGDAGTAATNAELRQTMSDIATTGSETLTSIRRLVGLLRDDPAISPVATLSDVEQIVEDLRHTHPGTTFTVDVTTRASWVPADLAATVHRLIQEAATNVRKHGDPGGSVVFDVRQSRTEIAISVENQETAGPTGPGYGIVGMRERVVALGGTFTAGPAGLDRWTVKATLPLHQS